MVFRRSSMGITNYSLFYNSSAVLHIEGGNNSYDMKFWSNIISIFRINSKIKVKPSGSKVNLISIANDIIRNKITNTLVAMDRDHDNHLGLLIEHRCILYTYGYSWENDVLQPKIIEKIINTLSNNPRNSIISRQIIKELFKSFCSDLDRAVYLDILLSQKKMPFFPRSGSRFDFIEIDKKRKPFINKSKIKQLIKLAQRKKTSKMKSKKKINHNVLRDCYGHLLEHYVHKSISYLLYTFGLKQQVAKKFINALGLEYFTLMLKNNELKRICNHYKKHF